MKMQFTFKELKAESAKPDFPVLFKLLLTYLFQFRDRISVFNGIFRLCWKQQVSPL